MAKADYDYNLVKYKGRVDVITIKDLDLGNVSVTNDIENVVEDICRLEKVKAEDYMIVYRDSSRQWDGFNTASKDIVILGMDKWYDSVEVWLSRKTEL